MSVTTYFESKSSWGARIKKAIKTAFANMIAAREAEARRMVASHLAMYQNDKLRKKGTSRKVARAPGKLVYRH